MGAALVKRFAREGFNIAMLARQADEVHNLEDVLSGNDIIAKGYAVDLGDFAALKAVFSTIRADFGTCNMLVYNAAQWRETLAIVIDAATFHGDLAVCVTSALLCAQLIYSDMKKAGGGSRNTPFDPDRIANEYWTMYSEARDAWTIEHVFDGK
jgi:NAD(P)-dependent dehydrogenase (short-subunit alcohol dehydrogenase family)